MKKTDVGVLTIVLSVAAGLAAGYLFFNQRNVSYDYMGGMMYGYSNPRYGQTDQRGNAYCDCDMSEFYGADEEVVDYGTLPTEVKMAIDKALDDEYKAYTLYETILAKNGSVRPFSMIINAEQMHISALLSLYERYGETPIANQWKGKLIAPATITMACQNGVDAEIANASLYSDQLLPVVEGFDDVTRVFTSLKNASLYQHLPAFERCN